MAITLILALITAVLALALGVTVGSWRGPVLGIAAGLGVLAAAVGGYVVVFSLSLPM